MNEKTPNVQTQAAMTQAREMARNRMLKLVMPTDGAESFPSFTNPARQRWESIPADVRQRLLSNESIATQGRVVADALARLNQLMAVTEGQV
jgi:hypothetical protein